MEAIAIIGIGCRFPQAYGPAELWQLLLGGVDAISMVPSDRWDAEHFYASPPQTIGKMNSRYGGFLDRIDEFDAEYFGISPREAVRMDPQQRLTLETAIEAIEDANLPVAELAGTTTGVYMGFGVPEYFQHQVLDPADINEYTNSGNTLSMIANRVSYALDLRGPSLSLDTACSSSLVAVHLACQGLQTGQTQLALAGGVSVIINPSTSIGFSQLRALAPDGRCRTFDADASGYVRGEGVGVVVLKRLTDALRDGDRIYASIRGGAVNQDGRTGGITAPNRFAQEEVLRKAYQNAGIKPSDVEYIEAHGTGTPLGDPIEASALGAVVGANRQEPCAIGSIKTNIGHCESAAGIAGLIKTSLAIFHGKLPGSLHYARPNPLIDFDALHLRVQTAATAWPSKDERRLAGVSAFGYGGTNVHLVLESATLPRVAFQAQDNGTATDCFVLPITGRSTAALRAAAQRMRDFLSGAGAEHSLQDICLTAALARTHYEHRLCVVGENREAMVAAISAFLSGYSNPPALVGHKRPNSAPRIAFMFEHGSHSNLGQALGRFNPSFQSAIDDCMGCAANTYLSSAVHASPAWQLFRNAFATTKLLRAARIRSGTMVGHWIGDGVMSCLQGRLQLEQAVAMIVQAEVHAQGGPLCAVATTKSYSEAAAQLDAHKIDTLIHIGTAPSRELSDGRRHYFLHQEGEHEVICWLHTMAGLFTQGCDIDWRAVYGRRASSHVALPSYPFQRQRYWFASRRAADETRNRGRSSYDMPKLIDNAKCEDYSRATRGAEAAAMELVELTTVAVGEAVLAGNLPVDPKQKAQPNLPAQVDLHKSGKKPSLNGRLELNRHTLEQLAPQERNAMLLAYLRQRLAAVLEQDVSKIGTETPMQALGLDSLSTFKIAAEVEYDLEVEIPMSDMFESHSLADFTNLMLLELEKAE